MKAKQFIAGALVVGAVFGGMVTGTTSKAAGNRINQKPKAETRKQADKRAREIGAKVFKVTSKATAKSAAKKIWSRWLNNKPSVVWKPKLKYNKYMKVIKEYTGKKATEYYGMEMGGVTFDTVTSKEIKENKQEYTLESKIVKDIKKYIADHRKDYQWELDNGEMSPSEVDAECFESWLLDHCDYAYTSKENTEIQAKKKYPKNGHKRIVYVYNAWINGTYKANCAGGSAYAFILGSRAGYTMSMKTDEIDGVLHDWAVMKVTDVNGKVYAKGIDATSDGFDRKWTSADED